MQTPKYIKALIQPNGGKPAGRKVWSLDLESVWLPFFTATNTTGETHIAHDALGAPIRLAFAKDGSVKFGANGKPTMKVAKELGDMVKVVRENFTAELQGYAAQVIGANGEAYQSQIELAMQAGEPIIESDSASLAEALQRRAEAEADALACAEAKAQAEAPAEAPVRELVPA